MHFSWLLLCPNSRFFNDLLNASWECNRMECIHTKMKWWIENVLDVHINKIKWIFFTMIYCYFYFIFKTISVVVIIILFTFIYFVCAITHAPPLCSIMVQWVMVDPLSYFSLQPVFHDWFNKGCDMYYPVCGMVNVKYPLLLIEKSSQCSGSSRFPPSCYLSSPTASILN